MGVVGGSARKGRIGREKRGTREERGPGEDCIGDFVGEDAREATCVEAEAETRAAGALSVRWTYRGGTRLAEVAVVAALAAGGHERRRAVDVLVVVAQPQRTLPIVVQRHRAEMVDERSGPDPDLARTAPTLLSVFAHNGQPP